MKTFPTLEKLSIILIAYLVNVPKQYENFNVTEIIELRLNDE